MLNLEYVIHDVKPHSGILRDVHKRMLKKECEIVELERGHSAVFMYYTDDTKTWWRSVYTSPVGGVDIHQNGDLTIYTSNTVYELKKI